MSTQIIDSDRTFQLWKYTVGHGQLLLRSTKGPNVPTRIDVLFKGVSEFHLPTLLSGLSVQEASDDQIRDLCSLRESPSFNHGKVYRVKGTDFIGYVAALSCYCHEDEGEYYSPSFFSKSNYPQIRPVISVTLSPKVCGDWDKLQHALSVLAQQDPSMRTTTQPTERRVIIKGRGELHLQAICDRLVREFGVPLDLEKLIGIMPSIEVDFNNCDREGRVRLNTIGALRSLNESQVAPRSGLEVELISGDLFPIYGIVEYSDSERIWVARFDINDLRDNDME